MKRGLILLILFLVTGGCAKNSNRHDPTRVREEITQRWNAFSRYWEAEDAASCSEMYTVNGVNIPPELAVKTGREAIEDFYQMLFDGHIRSTYRHTINDVEVFGSHALEFGAFTVDWVRNDSTAWTFSARSITHWEKQEDNQWQIAKFIFNQAPVE